jgi:hypothetical protein
MIFNFINYLYNYYYGYVETICSNCSKPITVTSNKHIDEYIENKTIYCSIYCMNKPE